MDCESKLEINKTKWAQSWFRRSQLPGACTLVRLSCYVRVFLPLSLVHRWTACISEAPFSARALFCSRAFLISMSILTSFSRIDRSTSDVRACQSTDSFRVEVVSGCTRCVVQAGRRASLDSFSMLSFNCLRFIWVDSRNWTLVRNIGTLKPWALHMLHYTRDIQWPGRCCRSAHHCQCIDPGRHSRVQRLSPWFMDNGANMP